MTPCRRRTWWITLVILAVIEGCSGTKVTTRSAPQIGQYRIRTIAVPVMLVLIPQGVVPYLWGAMISAAAIACILLTLLVNTEGIDLGSIRTALLPSTVAALVAAVLVAAVATGLPLGGVLQIAVSGALLAAAYIGTLRLLFRPELDQLLRYLPKGELLRKLLKSNRDA